MTEQHTPATQGTADSGTTGGTAVAGPLTIRDLAVLGAVAIIFIGSLIPLVVTDVGSFNLWSTTNLFYVGIGMVLPLAVGALFVIRRFSPGTRLRLGSLSLDQFASVVAVFAVFFFFAGTATNFRIGYLVGLIGAVVLMASTTCAMWIPVLAADFAGRAEVPAHVTARDAVAPAVHPASPKPVGAKAPAASGSSAAAASGWSASRPGAAGHTAAGQVFTPAKDARTASAGSDTGAAAVFGAAAGASAAAPSATPAASPAAATPAASAVATPAQGAGSAVGSSTAAAPAAAEAGTTALPQAVDPVEDLPTSFNPQLPEQPAEEAPAKASIAATVDPAAAPAVSAEPFWFAVDRPQNVIDETTRQFVFKLAPGAWILALEDRGNSFLVQDSHGKTGVLLDLVGIERASDSQ